MLFFVWSMIFFIGGQLIESLLFACLLSSNNPYIYPMKKIGLLLLAISFFACGTSTKPCTYGSPTAIFNKELKGVLEHQFSGRRS